MVLKESWKTYLDYWGTSYWARNYWYRHYVNSGQSDLFALETARRHAVYANNLHLRLWGQPDRILVSIILEADKKIPKKKLKDYSK